MSCEFAWDSPESRAGNRALDLALEYRDFIQTLIQFQTRLEKRGDTGNIELIDAEIFVHQQYLKYSVAWLEYCKLKYTTARKLVEDKS